MHEVQVEGTFLDGTKLVTVHDPITLEDGDLDLALYGSFLPLPDLSKFGPPARAPRDLPGHVECLPGELELYPGRRRLEIDVTSRGDRPIQVGSHYPFAATNAALDFDRGKAEGMHLDIPAGTAVRFEPGETRKVTLVENAGDPGAVTRSAAAIARSYDRASGKLPDIDLEEP